MSYRILEKKVLIPGQTTLLVIHAPHVAKKAQPGNFVILRTSEKGERIPLTIADCDAEAGTVSIVFLVVGKSTAELNTFEEGMSLPDFCGPLGKATHIEKQGTVICVGGGTGVAAMHHIAKGHASAGNRVVAVIGARNKDLLLFCSELGNFCPEVLVATDDGSQGHKGFVTEVLRARLEEDKDVSEVVAIGPVPMMEAVAKVTKPFGVKTTVSLNAIMVDGIGMCGACRCTVGGETKFACVDGPEFDGHQVDFGELRLRLGQFRPQEQESMQLFQHKCQCGEGK
ncbi:sulfide/dihydroorotate dehydrogenase-like FAD/NAD-binding protein [Humidesulfovibrio sp.]